MRTVGGEGFILAEWIGCGKYWSDRVPSCVKQACGIVRKVPESAHDTLIPSSTMTVSAVLASPYAPLKSKPCALPQYVIHTPNILEDDPSLPEFPNTLQNICRQSFFNALPHISALRTSFHNAWLAGAKSICIPSTPNYRYPLWTEHLLGDLWISVWHWVEADHWFRILFQLPLDVQTESLLEECQVRLLGCHGS